MVNQYRLKRDPEYKELVGLLGDENEHDGTCGTCGAKIEGCFTTVEMDQDHNVGPTAWLFCSARCLKKKLESRKRKGVVEMREIELPICPLCGELTDLRGEFTPCCGEETAGAKEWVRLISVDKKNKIKRRRGKRWSNRK